MSSIYDFIVTDIDGIEVRLSDYRGKVLLIVNVASRCGFTDQYADLQKLHETYGERGLVILGFPANNFLWQEPGSNDEIKQFCTTRYAVTFPMFAKISVKGSDQHPLYAFLTSKKTNPRFGGAVAWNFNKFLVGRGGQVMDRFGSRAKPMGDAIGTAVEHALAKPAPGE